jgi:adenylosuccinate synthase
VSRASVVVDLGYGDGGKGATTDYLVRGSTEPSVVIRYNGGAQCGHTVVTEEGQRHIFQQFGSGTLAGAPTFLSRFVLVNPIELFEEANKLAALGIDHPLKHIWVSENATLTTPFHIAANRIREWVRGDKRHGSRGMGIGETMSDRITHPELSIQAKDCRPGDDNLIHKLVGIQEIKAASFTSYSDRPGFDEIEPEYRILNDLDIVRAVAEDFRRFGQVVKLVPDDFIETLIRLFPNLVFEGAQGVLLDQDFGFPPYVTWSDTTCRNADLLLAEADYQGENCRYGVLRAYSVRHGAGPFVAGRHPLDIEDTTNVANPWQGSLRTGPFDLVMAKYALKLIGGVDALHLSCLDQLPGPKQVIESYRDYSPEPSDSWRTQRLFEAVPGVLVSYKSSHGFIRNIEQYLNTSVTVAGFGPTAQQRVLVRLRAA